MYWLYVSVAGFAMHGFLSGVGRLCRPLRVWQAASCTCLASRIYSDGIAVQALPLLLWLSDRILSSSRQEMALHRKPGRADRFAALQLPGAQLVASALGRCTSVLSSSVARLRTGLWRRLGEWALVWGLGLLLYAPVLATLLVFLPQCQRIIWDPMRTSARICLPPTRTWTSVPSHFPGHTLRPRGQGDYPGI